MRNSKEVSPGEILDVEGEKLEGDLLNWGDQIVYPDRQVAVVATRHGANYRYYLFERDKPLLN